MQRDPMNELGVDLGRVRDAEQQLAEAKRDLQRSVLDARRAGVSWSEIAERVGITRQAAAQRFGRAPIPLDEPKPLTRQQRRAAERKAR